MGGAALGVSSLMVSGMNIRCEATERSMLLGPFFYSLLA